MEAVLHGRQFLYTDPPKGVILRMNDMASIARARDARTKGFDKNRRQAAQQAGVIVGPDRGDDGQYIDHSEQRVLSMRLVQCTNAYQGDSGEPVGQSWRNFVVNGAHYNKSYIILPLHDIGPKFGRDKTQQKAMEDHYGPKSSPPRRPRLHTTNAVLILDRKSNATSVINESAGHVVFTGAGVSKAEWCHCRASCLGGPTARNNLFAGSFSCNTFMLAIEDFLAKNSNATVNSQTVQFQIEVTLYYQDKTVDDRTTSRLAPYYLRYRVVNARTGTPPLDFYIYARCAAFNHQDAQAVQGQLMSTFPGTQKTFN
jgi:hypothetical protein